MGRTSDLKRQYSEAYRSNDRTAMAEARDSWMNLQASRRRNGYDAKPLSDLLKAPNEQRKREAGVTGGVTHTRANEGMVKSLQEL